jgi:hypothetical protein
MFVFGVEPQGELTGLSLSSNPDRNVCLHYIVDVDQVMGFHGLPLHSLTAKHLDNLAINELTPSWVVAGAGDAYVHGAYKRLRTALAPLQHKARARPAWKYPTVSSGRVVVVYPSPLGQVVSCSYGIWVGGKGDSLGTYDG